MRDFREAIGRVLALRRKFEALLASARRKAAGARVAPLDRAARLRELTGFGANPGNLRMFLYAPDRLPPEAPLIVALHGCTQTAEEYDYGTGWSSLSDELGFAILFPQQQPTNNPKSCFSWFLPGDIARGSGEALSIRAMIEHAIAICASDRRKVFVTGLSAGGAMASAMLATYPEIFAGGAIIAGLPYGCASNVQQAFEAMFTEETHAARTLGDRVRAASTHHGPWPRISVWHGTNDPIVKPANGEDIVRQWINVHGLSDSPSYQELIGTHTRRTWSDTSGNAVVEAFSISGMGHGVPLAAAADGEGCGVAGAFFLDAGISSTHHIARFWRLHESFLEAPRAAESIAASMQSPTERPLIAGAAAEGWHAVAGDRLNEEEEQRAHKPFDPNDVIAASFKAVGLPVPEVRPDATKRVAPGPIIAAALKAAGLVRS